MYVRGKWHFFILPSEIRGTFQSGRSTLSRGHSIKVMMSIYTSHFSVCCFPALPERRQVGEDDESGGEHGDDQ